MMLSSIFAVLWLLCGLVAVVSMLQMLGGAKRPAGEPVDGEPDAGRKSAAAALRAAWGSPRGLRWTHRVSGGLFSAGYVIFLLVMVPRYQANGPLLPCPFVVHAYLGAALLPLLLVKHMVVRLFKKYYPALPYLGVTMLVVAAGIVSLTGAHYLLLWAKGPSVQVNPVDGERTVSAALGQELLHSKCARCHSLQPVYIYRKTEGEWRLTLKRMADKQRGLVSGSQADHIVGFLKAELGAVD